MANQNTYFDESQNEIDKKKYYENIDPSDTNGIKSQLSALISASHLNKLDYNPSLYLYPQVDRQKSGKLFSIYSGKEFDLDEILMMDAQISIRRLSMIEIQSRNLIGKTLSDDELATIEEAHPYNCEHVVPQSWFNKKLPMKGDLHHLFACEVNCNRFRGNNKYHDFPDYKEVIKEDCGKMENGFFEPKRNKGIVARAVLYFLLRYLHLINEYNEDNINMLLNWHSSEKIVEYELHRNQVIYKLQGNRNPLIDHPEWSNIIF